LSFLIIVASIDIHRPPRRRLERLDQEDFREIPSASDFQSDVPHSMKIPDSKEVKHPGDRAGNFMVKLF
jgi:hypothetical protein